MPPAPTLLDHIRDAGQSVVGIGKISDIFAGRGLGFSIHSEGNRDGMHLTLEALATLDRGLLFVNLVDFDMLYGHRNDAAGFARALGELDRWLPELEAALRPDDAVFITADHGNDPTTPGTDHTREQVPLLAFGPAVRPARLGTRASFAISDRRSPRGWASRRCAHGESFLAALRGPGMKRAPLARPVADRGEARRRRARPTPSIRAVIAGAARGDIPDYQLSALLMAIVWRGMTTRELDDLDRGDDRLGRAPALGPRCARPPSTSTRRAASATRSRCRWRRWPPRAG